MLDFFISLSYNIIVTYLTRFEGGIAYDYRNIREEN